MRLQPMLCEKFTGKLPAGSWICEPKLDGHRALWDGEALWARSGKPIYNPPEVLAYLREHFAEIALDGELCGATWGATQSAIKRKDATYNTGVRYFVFDLLAAHGAGHGGTLCGKTLFDRRNLLVDIFRTRTGDNQHAPVVLIPFDTLDDGDPAEAARAFIAQGFEGAVLKRLSSPYLCGIRSRDWLKVKFTQEVEVAIIGATEGENRLTGSLGALEVRDPNGTEFRVGSGFTDAERQRLWQMYRAGQLVGLQVSVAYQNDKGFRGRFPVFLRLRDDLPYASGELRVSPLPAPPAAGCSPVPVYTCPNCGTKSNALVHCVRPDDEPPDPPPPGCKDTGEGDPSGIPDAPEDEQDDDEEADPELSDLELEGNAEAEEESFPGRCEWCQKSDQPIRVARVGTRCLAVCDPCRTTLGNQATIYA